MWVRVFSKKMAVELWKLVQGIDRPKRTTIACGMYGNQVSHSNRLVSLLPAVAKDQILGHGTCDVSSITLPGVLIILLSVIWHTSSCQTLL